MKQCLISAGGVAEEQNQDVNVYLVFFHTLLFYILQAQVTDHPAPSSGAQYLSPGSSQSIYHFFLPIQVLISFSSVAQSRPTLRPYGLQHTRLPCPSPIPRACSHSCPLSRWCHPTISSSVVNFSCLQPFPASGSFPMIGSVRMYTS